ncbi:PREDICTED: B2 protein [Camelina sativa]|uniref:B2 protein n=1 Tax=Camelina sativa TaxID=90675 RepID=A0ABM0ZDW7_CAMSA|nr:PREDICTED: B2 protein [Camelina sativa]
MDSFWQLGDELRGQTRATEDHKWSTVATKLAEQTRMKGERMNNLDLSKGYTEFRPNNDNKFSFQDSNNNLNFNMLNLDAKFGDPMIMGKASSMQGNVYNMNTALQKNDFKSGGNNAKINKYSGNVVANKEMSNNNKHSNNSNDNGNMMNLAVDKRFKTLPASETLPRNEVLGGYIFVCNNDTMQEDMKRHLFGLPPRYRDSVRAITPGLPLFLYNYTTHQLHGIFEATTFGGTNIDATAWEDKKCKGESRFPAQVRIRVRKICKALEEDSFRPVLHHYDGPKFRLELSVPETLDLLDLCEQAGSA